MQTIESMLYLSAVSVSLFCLLLVVMCRQHILRLPFVLVAIMALYAAGFIMQILMHSPGSYWKHLWMFLAISHSFMLGPAVWLYCRFILGEPSSWRVLNWSKRSLALIGIFMASPLLFLVHNGADWIHASHPSSSAFWTSYYIMASGYIVAYFVQAVLYIYALSKLNKRIFEKPLNLKFFLKANDEEPLPNRVLKMVLFGYYASVFINLCRVIHCGLIADTSMFSPILSMLDISVTLLVLFGIIISLVKSTASTNQTKSVLANDPQGYKYQHSALSSDMRARIKAKIETLMTKPEVFTASDLNLPKLATMVGEKHHYVSQVINQDFATTFFDLVNRARVEHAKCLMRQNTSLAVVDLIELVGFNSKSTFYSAFSKYVGTTPAKFKNAAAASSTS